MKYDAVFQKCTYVKDLPLITVNLALPPLPRWQAVLDECAEHNISVSTLIQESQTYMDSLLPKKSSSVFDLRSTSTSWIGQWLRYCLLILLGLICRLFYSYSEDVVALASLTNIHTGELFLANIAYEVLGGCTSFVVHDDHNRPMLGRTLDWPMPLLAKYTVQFRWIHEKVSMSSKEKDKKKDPDCISSDKSDSRDSSSVLFYSVGWPGYVGVMTASKPFHFAVALNARYPEASYGPWLLWLLQHCWGLQDVAGEEGSEVHEVAVMVSQTVARLASVLRRGGTAWSTGALLRSALQHPLHRHTSHTQSTADTNTKINSHSYAHVVEYLSTACLAVPCYFIIAGVEAGEGVVLTRDCVPMRTADLTGKRCMQAMDESIEEKNRPHVPSFVCQTNIDMPLQCDHSPEDFNSVDRYNVATQKLTDLFTAPGNCRNVASPYEVAQILMTSMNKKNGGVRMKMTLYCTIMSPHNGSIVSARATRRIGP